MVVVPARIYGYIHVDSLNRFLDQPLLISPVDGLKVGLGQSALLWSVTLLQSFITDLLWGVEGRAGKGAACTHSN